MHVSTASLTREPPQVFFRTVVTPLPDCFGRIRHSLRRVATVERPLLCGTRETARAGRIRNFLKGREGDYAQGSRVSRDLHEHRASLPGDRGRQSSLGLERRGDQRREGQRQRQCYLHLPYSGHGLGLQRNGDLGRCFGSWGFGKGKRHVDRGHERNVEQRCHHNARERQLHGPRAAEHAGSRRRQVPQLDRELRIRNYVDGHIDRYLDWYVN